MSVPSQTRSRPPLVVGYRIRPFLVVGDERADYRCGIHGHPVDWPTTREQIWRGEVPDGASCSECGIDLAELE